MIIRHRQSWNQLVMMPPGAGMSILAHQVVMEQMAAGGAMGVLDTGSSAKAMAAGIHRRETEQVQCIMRVGRKRNGGRPIQPKAEPYYRKFNRRW